MSLQGFLLILKARARIIFATFFLVVATAVVLSILMPKTYKATAALVLNYKGADPVSGATVPAQLMPGYIATQVEIIKSKNVARRVVDALRLTESEALKQEFESAGHGNGNIGDWIADLLLRKLDVVPSRETSVLHISFSGNNPQFAAIVANKFAAEYQKTAIRLKIDPLQQASSYFNEKIKTLRVNLEEAQGRLSKYQQEKGIVSIDNRVDVESARLNELSTQLVIVQGQLTDALSRQRQASGAGMSESPDVMANPLVQNLKSSLVAAEARLSDLAARQDRNHPRYQSAKAETEKLRSELNEAIRAASGSIANSARIYQNREAEVRAALEAQRKKVLELNRARDELMVLVRDVESAQRAYDAVMLRFNQLNLEGQSNHVDVSVLSDAVPPLEHDSPRLALNVILAALLGAFLGLGLALLAEMLDRRVRSAIDLEEELQIPVLAVLGQGRSKPFPSLLQFAKPRKLQFQ